MKAGALERSKFQILFSFSQICFFTLLLSIILLSAKSVQSADDSEQRTVERIQSFLRSEEYTQAWAELEKIGETRNAWIYWQRGYMKFFGLHGNADKCGAVLDLEQAYRLGAKYAIELLNYIYNGDWVAVAAEEGQREALYELAESYHKSIKTGNLVSSISRVRALQDIFILYSRAKRQKAGRAYNLPDIVKLEILELGGEPPSIVRGFREIICPIREYE